MAFTPIPPQTTNATSLQHDGWITPDWSSTWAGQCTWYVGARITKLGWTNNGHGTIWTGQTWWNNAASWGLTRYRVPHAGDIACFTNHVAFVESISNGSPVFLHGNWRGGGTGSAYIGTYFPDGSDAAGSFLGYVSTPLTWGISGSGSGTSTGGGSSGGGGGGESSDSDYNPPYIQKDPVIPTTGPGTEVWVRKVSMDIDIVCSDGYHYPAIDVYVGGQHRHWNYNDDPEYGCEWDFGNNPVKTSDIRACLGPDEGGNFADANEIWSYYFIVEYELWYDSPTVGAVKMTRFYNPVSQQWTTWEPV